jgi:hypothetical protein
MGTLHIEVDRLVIVFSEAALESVYDNTTAQQVLQ